MKPFIRPSESYGDVDLSVQASSLHYCWPREDGLPLDQYTHVEVALIAPKPKTVLGRCLNRTLCKPSEIGIVGFDHLFEDAELPVAPYVSQEDVERLRLALKARMEAMVS